MKRVLVCFGALLLVASAAAAADGASAATAAVDPACATAEPLFALASGTGPAPAPAASGETENLSYCSTYAECHDGTWIWCEAWGSNTKCDSQDAICTSKETVQGAAYCHGSESGIRTAYCPKCPPPSACIINGCASRPNPNDWCAFECNRQCTIPGGICNLSQNKCSCGPF